MREQSNMKCYTMSFLDYRTNNNNETARDNSATWMIILFQNSLSHFYLFCCLVYRLLIRSSLSLNKYHAIILTTTVIHNNITIAINILIFECLRYYLFFIAALCLILKWLLISVIKSIMRLVSLISTSTNYAI